MTITSDRLGDFLQLANPDLDLAYMQESTTKDQPALAFSDFRLVFAPDTPLLPGERFPASFALPNDTVLLSRSHIEGYIQDEVTSLFVHPAHQSLLFMIQAELKNDYNSAHGTLLTNSRGCNGPLCRRPKRQQNTENAVLARFRREYKQGKNNPVPKEVTDPRARYLSLQKRSPRYASVDPLLLAYTAHQLTSTPPEKPTKQELVLINLVKTDRLLAYLARIYGEQVQ